MKKLSGVFAAVIAAVSIISAPAASAAEGNLVNFGDSIAADSPTFAYIGNRIARTFQYGSSIPGKTASKALPTMGTKPRSASASRSQITHVQGRRR